MCIRETHSQNLAGFPQWRVPTWEIWGQLPTQKEILSETGVGDGGPAVFCRENAVTSKQEPEDTEEWRVCPFSNVSGLWLSPVPNAEAEMPGLLRAFERWLQKAGTPGSNLCC